MSLAVTGGNQPGQSSDSVKDSESGPEPRTTIEDLPSDVVLVIFHDILCDIRESESIFIYRHPIPLEDETQELGKWPSCDNDMEDLPFPECLASVCPRWRDAMSAVSAFWTVLVIWVGKSDPTPLSRVRECLEWSRAQSLDIYILQRPQESESVEEKAQVRQQVDAVMDLLVPHMGRWSLLRFQLHHASGLPRPRIELLGRDDTMARIHSRRHHPI